MDNLKTTRVCVRYDDKLRRIATIVPPGKDGTLIIRLHISSHFSGPALLDAAPRKTMDAGKLHQ